MRWDEDVDRREEIVEFWLGKGLPELRGRASLKWRAPTTPIANLTPVHPITYKLL